MIQEKITFSNTNGEILDGIMRIPEGAGKFPAVILCHGFNMNKDNEFIFGLWDIISRAGFVCMRFDFTGHGDSQGNFREMTVLQEVHDVLSAAEYLKSTNIIDDKRIALVGHGFGASAAILAAERHRFRAVAEIDGFARVEDFVESRFTQHQIGEWRRQGFVQFHNFDELGIDFLNDIHKHDVLSALKKIKCPLLIVHGTDDTEIPFENAREIFNHAEDPKQLELVEGADHFFRNPSHREYLYDVVVDFLLRNLK